MLSTAALCLALNVYHESRGEPPKGRQAVAQVTLHHARVTNRVCDEVFKSGRYTWANKLSANKSLRQRIAFKQFPKNKSWDEAQQVASLALQGKFRHVVPDSTNYHSVRVRPTWARRMQLVQVIGNHKFYRSRG